MVVLVFMQRRHPAHSYCDGIAFLLLWLYWNDGCVGFDDVCGGSIITQNLQCNQ